MHDDLRNLKEIKIELLASLLRFTQYFYELRTGRVFAISYPVSRESHYIAICRELTKIFKGEVTQLNINVAPRYGKSELLIHFVAWALAHYPDSNFLYISYSHALATKQTQTIREIVSLPAYRQIFGVEISDSTSAKDNFETSNGGSVYAAGSGGTITGRGAGIKNTTNRFGGAMVFDDIIKPDEATSDVIREGIVEWYYNTAQSRRNNGNQTPVVNIGQRVHEADLTSHLIEKGDWSSLIIKTLDDNDHALDPRMHTAEDLLVMKERDPYVFAAQYQQNPQPAGGGLFKTEWFSLLDIEPEILATFITVDTAETAKTYNDATVFSFWGIYNVTYLGNSTDKLGLHWIDCHQVWVEPKDLESEFIHFLSNCMRCKVKPSVAAIEKKSTGTTLLSILSNYQGLHIINIDRPGSIDGKANSKTARFLAAQPYIAQKLVSLPRNGKHTQDCLKHMVKITANQSHRYDDICFIAGTKIATLFGYKAIEKIKCGDFVITPFGLRRVVACGLSRRNVDVVKFNSLIGTGNHPIFDGIAFKRMDTLSDAAQLDILLFGGIFKWRYRKLLYLMESNIKLWAREDIILANQMIIRKGSVLKDCMWRFGNFIAEKRFQKASLFIIKTGIVLITTTATWSVFITGSILGGMQKRVKELSLQLLSSNILQESESKQKNGIAVRKEETGTGKTPKPVAIKLRNIFAIFATRNSKPNHAGQNIALTNATKSMMPKGQENEGPQDVYNLTVKDVGVYYANNILVSNCDTLADAVDIELSRKLISSIYVKPSAAKSNATAREIMSQFNKISAIKGRAYGGQYS